MGTQTSLAARRPLDDPGDFRDALEYQAPFLIEKLIKNRSVNDAVEGELLFTEVKRYLMLTQLDRDEVSWEMYSLRVDEVWHQFVLYTHEYAAFCDRYFGRFLHHRPSNAPELSTNRRLRSSSFPTFRARYAEVFGKELPECWMDSRNVSVARRVINDKAGRLVVSECGGRVSLIHEDGTVQLSIESIAREAIAFIATTGAFYVRELPGDLTDQERIAIAAALVEHRLLRVAS